MARIRSVHPDLCASKKMAELSPALERTFVRLWTYLDDEGRGIDDPRLIKAAIYPQHDRQTWHLVDGELTQLMAHGLVDRYKVGDTCYLCVKPESWSQYQHPQKARTSTFPPPEGWPPDDTRTTPVQPPDDTGPVVVVVDVEGVVDVVGEVTLVPSVDDTFEDCWRHYPKKIRRAEALKGYRARRKAGVSAADLLTATRNYATEQAGKDPTFTMLGPTFYGPNDRWRDYLEEPTSRAYVPDRIGNMRREMGLDTIGVPATNGHTPALLPAKEA